MPHHLRRSWRSVTILPLLALLITLTGCTSSTDEDPQATPPPGAPAPEVQNAAVDAPPGTPQTAAASAQTPAPGAPAPEPPPSHQGMVAQSTYGMIVSAEKNATLAGLAVLESGGNAIDAAVAVAYALAVTHPTAGNLGGGGFMVVHLKDGRSVAIDYREKAPAAAARDMYLDEEGMPVMKKSTFGGMAAGIPGTVAGLELARSHFGTKPHAELVQASIRLARDGHVLDAEHAREMAVAAAVMDELPDSLAIFTNEGKPYRAGDLFVQKDLGETLQYIADQGASSFYHGELAKRLVEGAQKVGAIWTEEDLAAYEAVEREPIRIDYRGHTVISMPPPSSGGVVLAQMLFATQHMGLADYEPYSADEIHLYTEITKRMYADRNEWLGDPDFMDLPIAGLLDEVYLKDRLASVKMDRSTPKDQIGPGQPPGAPQPPAVPASTDAGESEETTHFSVVDRFGNAVSNTYTLNLNFGSKAVAVGTGVLLNDEMDDFSAKPGMPNSFGLVQGERNAVQPGKRMLSSMTPTIVLKDGRVRLVVGSPGGSTIITTVFQILRHVLDHGWSLQRAVEAKRIHNQGLPTQIYQEENAVTRQVFREVVRRGHQFVTRRPIGAAHCIEVDRETGVATGVVDPREGGLAAGPQE